MMFAGVPLGIGIRLLRVRTSVDRATQMIATRGDSAVVAQMEIADQGVSVRWTAQPTTLAAAPLLLGGPDEQSDAAAALRAARSIGVPASYDASHSIAIALPGYAKRAMPGEVLPSEPWMIDVLARVSAALPGDGPRATQRAHELVLYCDTPAASVGCASIMSAAMRANSSDPSPGEFEPERIGEADLARWDRAPAQGTDVRRAGDWLTGPSDARWLWGLALLLLAIETVVRRRRAVAASSSREQPRDLAA